jgi:outer membrane receptor for ferrienterochelin and colicins
MKMHFRELHILASCAAASAVFLGTLAYGQEETPVATPDIVVTGSAWEKSLKDNANIIQVISREDIERMQPDSLGELIEYETGTAVETGTGSGFPNRSVISLNGLPPRYTLVLVNGMKLLTEHIHTGQNVDMIPAEAVERIEIMRGAASAQYGSDAIGGIVNIITRKYKGKAEAGGYASAGSYETYEGGAHALVPAGPGAGIASFVSWRQSEGVDLIEPEHRKDNMGYRQLNWFNRVDAALNDNTQIYGWMNWSENRMEWFGDTTDSTLVAPVAGIVHLPVQSVGLWGELAYSHWEADLNSEENRLWEPEVFASWRANKSHTILFGGEYRHNEFTRNAVDAPDQDAHGIYAQDEWEISEVLSLLTALRYDKVEDLDPAISPKASALYSPHGQLQLRVSVSRGYHAPTLQELYEEGYGHGGAAYRFGNPDLDPEYSTTYTAGFEAAPISPVKLAVNGFYSRIDDLIVPVFEGAWDKDPTIDVWRRRNIEEALIYGAEANVAARLSLPWLFECGYTYTDNKNEGSERKLPYSPGSSASARVTYTRKFSREKDMTFFVGARAVFDREAWNWKPGPGAPTDTPEGLTTELEDYTKLDAGLKVRLDRDWTIFTKAENLLGEDIENLDDLHTIIDGKPVYTFGVKYRYGIAGEA